jgi:hypothetical protein
LSANFFRARLEIKRFLTFYGASSTESYNEKARL